MDSSRIPLIFLICINLFSNITSAEIERHLKNGKEVTQSKFIQNLMNQKEEKVNLAETAFALSKEIDPSVNTKLDLETINQIVKEVDKTAGTSNDPIVRINTLNQVISRNMGLKYDFSDPTAQKSENNLLSLTLRTRKGSCLTMPLLYLAVSNKLNWPIYPVIAPNHLFLRYYSPPIRPINIEVTSGGGSFSDESYIQKLNIKSQAIKNGVFMRNISKKEMVAVLLQFNSEFYFKERNHLKAFEYINAAIELFPKNPHFLMQKSSMFRRLSNDFLQKHDLYGSSQLADQAQNYGMQALELGYQKWDREQYLKQMAGFEKMEKTIAESRNKLR